MSGVSSGNTEPRAFQAGPTQQQRGGEGDGCLQEKGVMATLRISKPRGTSNLQEKANLSSVECKTPKDQQQAKKHISSLTAATGGKPSTTVIKMQIKRTGEKRKLKEGQATKSTDSKRQKKGADKKKVASKKALKKQEGDNLLEKVGRWTDEEHKAFKRGLELHGKEWAKVAALVGTRSVVQTRTHAQKYFQKLLKAANLVGMKHDQDKSKSAGNGLKLNQPFAQKLGPGSLALLARTSAGAEGVVKRLSDDTKYLELALSGTASTSRLSRAKANAADTEKLKSAKKGKVKANRNSTKSSKKKSAKKLKAGHRRPKPTLGDLSAAMLEEKFVGNAPGTPWAGHIDLLREGKKKSKSALSHSGAGLRKITSSAASQSTAATQKSLRYYPAQRTIVHEAVLTGDLEYLAKVLKDLAEGGMDVRAKLEENPKASTLSKQLSTLPPRPLVHPPTAHSILENLSSQTEKRGSGTENADKMEAAAIVGHTSTVESNSGDNKPGSSMSVDSPDAEPKVAAPAAPRPTTSKTSSHNPSLIIKRKKSRAVKKGISSISVAEAVNHPDTYGYTPLMVAAALDISKLKTKKRVKGDDAKSLPVKMCKLLFTYKAQTKFVDKKGYNCLHWAAAKGNRDILPMFLQRGCKKDFRSKAGNTALHLASCEGKIECVKYLLQHKADMHIRNQYYKTAMAVAASELPIGTLSQRKSAERLRDEIREVFFNADSSRKTLIVHHEECEEHEPRKSDEWEHPERIQVIMKEMKETKMFNPEKSLQHTSSFDRATVKALLRVHSPAYIRFIHDLSKQVIKDKTVIPFTPKVQKNLGVADAETKEDDICDTSFSSGSLPAARRAVGAVCHAIDVVLSGKNRNAFCAVRPPGHHAGTNGLLKNATSCGFCIFNNVAVGAMHALDHHNLNRVAIIDFDVHHGNGTEEIISGINDPNKIFFFSTHLFDRSKSYEFYPGTGKVDIIAKNISNAPMRPLWRRDSSGSVSMGRRRVSSAPLRRGRSYFRQVITQKLIPALRAYNPELILLSSGFDGSENDVGNCNHSVGRSSCGLDLRPSDYFWVVSKIQEIASICCNGRLISVLEGGYGQYVRNKLERKNLAKCVVAHVAALVDHNKVPLFESNGDDSDDTDESGEESSPESTIPPPDYPSNVESRKLQSD
jgi:SHAQKYF class myb-like DNA-binding protein